MYKATVLALALLCVTAGTALADDRYTQRREAEKRYWDHRQEMNRAALQADRERRELREERQREERRDFEEKREAAKLRAERDRTREKADPAQPN